MHSREYCKLLGTLRNFRPVPRRERMTAERYVHIFTICLQSGFYPYSFTRWLIVAVLANILQKQSIAERIFVRLPKNVTSNNAEKNVPTLIGIYAIASFSNLSLIRKRGFLTI